MMMKVASFSDKDRRKEVNDKDVMIRKSNGECFHYPPPSHVLNWQAVGNVSAIREACIRHWPVGNRPYNYKPHGQETAPKLETQSPNFHTIQMTGFGSPDRFTVYQPFCTVDPHWFEKLNPRLENGDHKFTTMAAQKFENR
ncbi:hypothetical protein TNCV_4198711 [Trichonephila clavipes]|nr:hypothetical protein TNCV_4198711 [Trichonephila clavipes]